ncbi:MAG: hypothetical protein GWM88_08755 [Pseudomonadales bacterium]|nr:hypothetical protein [Pseudomonadales bacterium]NIX08090.1 hypothetical protein [Pseudomonadales bacterium]
MINYVTKIGLIALVSALCFGCAEPEQTSAPEPSGQTAPIPRAEPPEGLDPAARAQWLIEAAHAAYSESEAAGHAWVSARRALEGANAAVDQADFAAAGEQGEKALRLAEASLAQARTEEDAWQDRFPKPRPQ